LGVPLVLLLFENFGTNHRNYRRNRRYLETAAVAMWHSAARVCWASVVLFVTAVCWRDI
jgi:hypothetical protein